MLPFYLYSKHKILQVFRLPIYLIMSHLLEPTMVDNGSKGFFLLMHDRHVSYERVVYLILHSLMSLLLDPVETDRFFVFPATA